MIYLTRIARAALRVMPATRSLSAKAVAEKQELDWLDEMSQKHASYALRVEEVVAPKQPQNLES